MKKIFFILSVVVFFYSCNKNAGEKHYKINSDLIAAFNYQKGTYWIYRDSLTGNVDSFYVYSNSGLSKTNDGNQIDDWIDIIIIDTNVSPGGKVSKIFEAISATNLITFQLSVQFSLGGGALYFSDNAPTNYPFVFGIYNEGNHDSSYINNIYISYNVNGKSFLNVAEIIHGPFAVPNSAVYKDWFYINNDFGIIKMRLNHPVDTFMKIFEIQRSNIIK